MVSVASGRMTAELNGNCHDPKPNGTLDGEAPESTDWANYFVSSSFVILCFLPLLWYWLDVLNMVCGLSFDLGQLHNCGFVHRLHMHICTTRCAQQISPGLNFSSLLEIFKSMR